MHTYLKAFVCTRDNEKPAKGEFRQGSPQLGILDWRKFRVNKGLTVSYPAIKSDRLIIFTRYPQPGKTKTRLIPALGAVGAAQLHRQLTEYTLAQVKELADSQTLSVEVRFAGGNRQLMRDWLGDRIVYQPQNQGDLGEEMAIAFQEALGAGSLRVVIIGTDCPGINAQLLANAFEQLNQHDLVLGPAADGGYYLIGLSQFIPELFSAITWGSNLVMQQTVAIATRKQISYTLLSQLADIDRPEDLAILDSQFSIQQPTSKISIIVPVLNEAGLIQETLAKAQLAANLEIIVVDGGSQDGTDQLARSMGVKVISAPAGRARQMNAGASVAEGDILLFLHADTQLPVGFDAAVRETLAVKGVVAGAFELRIVSIPQRDSSAQSTASGSKIPHPPMGDLDPKEKPYEGTMPGLRLIEMGVNWRSRFFQMPYGDQAIFLPASVFRDIGGFPDMAIMEDFEMIRRLRRQGKINIIPMPVLTSARRWQKLGVLKTTLINQLVILAYFLGVPPVRLAGWYRRDRGTS